MAVSGVGRQHWSADEIEAVRSFRVALIDALVSVGSVQIEAVRGRSPAMAGAAEVMAGPVESRGRYWALVPNLRGAELALDAGVDALTVTVAASEGYSQRNVNMSVRGVDPLRRAHLGHGRRPGADRRGRLLRLRLAV